jgi:hypothetical protein
MCVFTPVLRNTNYPTNDSSFPCSGSLYITQKAKLPVKHFEAKMREKIHNLPNNFKETKNKES